MSDITTVYDALITRLGTTLSSHVRLSNATAVEENNEQFLKLGWGLAIGEGSNANRYLCDILTIRRNFVLVITRKFYAREFDAVSKATTEKDLYEDQFLVLQDLANNNILTTPTGEHNVNFIGDNGTEAVHGDKDLFLVLRTNLEVEYHQQI